MPAASPALADTCRPTTTAARPPGPCHARVSPGERRGPPFALLPERDRNQHEPGKEKPTMKAKTKVKAGGGGVPGAK